MELGAAAATLRSTITALQVAGKLDLVKEVVALNATIMELYQDKAFAIEDALRLTREMAAMQSKVAVLEAQLALRDDMTFRDHVYWRTRLGQASDGPFCPRCMDGKQSAARMEDRPSQDWWICLTCSKVVDKPGRTSGGGGGHVASEWDPTA